MSYEFRKEPNKLYISEHVGIFHMGICMERKNIENEEIDKLITLLRELKDE